MRCSGFRCRYYQIAQTCVCADCLLAGYVKLIILAQGPGAVIDVMRMCSRLLWEYAIALVNNEDKTGPLIAAGQWYFFLDYYHLWYQFSLTDIEFFIRSGHSHYNNIADHHGLFAKQYHALSPGPQLMSPRLYLRILNPSQHRQLPRMKLNAEPGRSSSSLASSRWSICNPGRDDCHVFLLRPDTAGA